MSDQGVSAAERDLLRVNHQRVIGDNQDSLIALVVAVNTHLAGHA